VFLAGTILSLLSLYNFRYGRWEFPGGSSNIGYPLGLAAGLLILFEVLLWPRKKLLRRWRLGRVRTWMAAHIWLGLLIVPLTIAHAGIPRLQSDFPWVSSLVANGGMLLLFVVVASGIFGLVLQQTIPRKMTNAALAETVYSHIGAVSRQLVVEADALVSAATGFHEGDLDWQALQAQAPSRVHQQIEFVGANRSIANMFGKPFVVDVPDQPFANTEILSAAYSTHIRDYLMSGNESRSLLRDYLKLTTFFRDLKDKAPPESHAVILQLQEWCLERRDLDIQRTLHYWLYAWLAVHLPLSIALLVLVVWHGITASGYSGIFELFR
jgi:hypothetical protein